MLETKSKKVFLWVYNDTILFNLKLNCLVVPFFL